MSFKISDFSNKWSEFKATLTERAVDKSGDTMNGKLILSKHPEAEMEAATKGYIDELFIFVPGDFTVKTVTSSFRQSSSVINFWNLAVDDLNKPKIRSTTLSYTPLTNGTITLKCSFDPQYFDPSVSGSDYGWYGTHSSYPTRGVDAKVSYRLLLNTDGENDIVLYEKLEFRMQDAVKENGSSNKIIPGMNFSINVPVKRGVKFIFKQELTVHSLTDSSYGRVVGINVPRYYGSSIDMYDHFYYKIGNMLPIFI